MTADKQRDSLSLSLSLLTRAATSERAAGFDGENGVGYFEFCCERVEPGREGRWKPPLSCWRSFEIGGVKVGWEGRRGGEEEGEGKEGGKGRGEEDGGSAWLWDFFRERCGTERKFPFPLPWTGVCECSNGVVGFTGYLS